MPIYVLVYNEWDGGGGSVAENVIASSDRDKLVEHQAELESKSELVRVRMEKLEAERDERLKPLWQKFNPIIKELAPTKAAKLDAHRREQLVQQRRILHEKMTLIHNWFYEEKNKILNDVEIEYWIDDPELASFNIDELEEI